MQGHEIDDVDSPLQTIFFASDKLSNETDLASNRPCHVD
jgi:hypothetical protein